MGFGLSEFRSIGLSFQRLRGSQVHYERQVPSRAAAVGGDDPPHRRRLEAVGKAGLGPGQRNLDPASEVSGKFNHNFVI